MIPGQPVTSTTSIRLANSRRESYPLPSPQFSKYQELAGMYIPRKFKVYARFPVNVTCIYYMQTHKAVSLTELTEATDKVLVHYGVLSNSSSTIIAGHDGSRVKHDKYNPHVEITIMEMENDENDG